MGDERTRRGLRRWGNGDIIAILAAMVVAVMALITFTLVPELPNGCYWSQHLPPRQSPAQRAKKRSCPCAGAETLSAVKQERDRRWGDLGRAALGQRSRSRARAERSHSRRCNRHRRVRQLGTPREPLQHHHV